MKKILKLFFTMTAIMILVLSNYSFATSDFSNELNLNIITSDTLINGAFDSLNTSTDEANSENDIMPININPSEIDVSDIMENSSEIVDGDVYVLDENVTINQTVYGNVYAIGETVDISSAYVLGNVFAIGKNVKISGNILGSLYVLGEDITIDNLYAYTVYSLSANNISIGQNCEIQDDLKAVSKELSLDCSVRREFDAIAENIVIGDNVDTVKAGTVIYSNSITDSKNALANISVTKRENDVEETENAQSHVEDIARVAISNILIIAILYLIIKNRKFEKVENKKKAVLSRLLVGFLTLILVPVVATILLFTVVALPISIITLLAYFVVIYMSIMITSLKVAVMIYENNSNNSNKSTILLYSIAVYVVLKVLSLMPVIGFIVTLITVLFALGTIIKILFPRSEKKEEKVEIENTKTE